MKMPWPIPVLAGTVLIAIPASAQSVDLVEPVAQDEMTFIIEELEALEIASHGWWLENDLDALDALMMDEFYFVAMNGQHEAKVEVVGIGPERGGRVPGPLRVSELRIEPETVVVRENEAVVISLMHLRATVHGRPIPERHRIMSVFLRDGEIWRLFARSATPILAPPAPQDG